LFNNFAFFFMERIPSQPPKIAPLSEDITRPLWSVMIPVYNCSQFIPDALESVLSQDPGEDQMQIEVVDDGSTDADVEALVKNIGKGRIKYFRQPKNVGSLRNFETCITRAKGHLVHLLHGDDRVLGEFYSDFTEVFQKFPEAGAVFCGYSAIDEFGDKTGDARIVQYNLGLVEGAYLKIAAGLPIQFATIVVKREVYEKLGSFYGVIAGEDWEMWSRMASHYQVAYIPKILAEYRRYLGTISRPKKEDGVYAKSLAKTLLLIESRLPKKNRGVMKSIRKKRAVSSIKTAIYVWRNCKDLELVNELTKLALSLDSTSIKVYRYLFKLYYLILKYSILFSSVKNSFPEDVQVKN
jgi:glycosyltransferase involved in cell wall biosynthesis